MLVTWAYFDFSFYRMNKYKWKINERTTHPCRSNSTGRALVTVDYYTVCNIEYLIQWQHRQHICSWCTDRPRLSIRFRSNIFLLCRSILKKIEANVNNALHITSPFQVATLKIAHINWYLYIFRSNHSFFRACSNRPLLDNFPFRIRRIHSEKNREEHYTTSNLISFIMNFTMLFISSIIPKFRIDSLSEYAN